MILKNNTFSKIFMSGSFLFLLLGSVGPLLAQGNLLVYPKRIMLVEGKKKTEKLFLSNTGSETTTYTVSFVEYKMNENGALKIVTEPEPGLQFAASNVRVFPLEVTLAPGESQTVKAQIYNIQDLADGEYRSHLYFRAENKDSPANNSDESKSTSISIKVEPVFGISIPCILRKGVDDTSVSITDLQFVQTDSNDAFLQLKLNRIGKMSAYGDFKVKYTNIAGKTIEVSNMKGIGVYPPLSFRQMKIKLNKLERESFKGGFFKISFTQNDSKKVLAEAELKH
jgi:hypothetical protein